MGLARGATFKYGGDASLEFVQSHDGKRLCALTDIESVERYKEIVKKIMDNDRVITFHVDQTPDEDADYIRVIGMVGNCGYMLEGYRLPEKSVAIVLYNESDSELDDSFGILEDILEDDRV